MRDIQNRKDIEFLIDEFYKKLISDDLIGFFFTEIVELDWEKHIPVMYDFWESMLLGKAVYQGNPMLKHIELNKNEPMTNKHFDRWLTHWEDTIKENFEGLKAQEAISRAKQIGELMKLKIAQHKAS